MRRIPARSEMKAPSGIAAGLSVLAKTTTIKTITCV